jgi:hypothetical protein
MNITAHSITGVVPLIFLNHHKKPSRTGSKIDPPIALELEAPFTTTEGSVEAVVWLAVEDPVAEVVSSASVPVAVVVAASEVFTRATVVVDVASDDVSDDTGNLIPQAASASNVKGIPHATQPSEDLSICSIYLISR